MIIIIIIAVDPTYNFIITLADLFLSWIIEKNNEHAKLNCGLQELNWI